MLASNLLVLCFFLLSAHAATSPAAPSSNGNPSFLELNVGLNLSVRASFNVAIAAYGAYFSPILSSSGFNSTDSSKSLGFSVGFLFSRSSSSGYVNGNIYLAVCGGLSGNYSKISEIIGMWGRDDAGKAEIFPSLVADGYVVPVWIANPDNPLSSVESSLVVVAVSDQVGGATSISNELQLRDHNGRVVWRVSSNASSMMEMQDTGNLVIYDSMSTTNVVWQSSTQPRDTLLQGQMLTVGKELTSNDSSYSVRMEKGGLVFYDNNAQFIEQPSPYWVIPILYDTRATNLLNLNSLVFSPPCSTDGAYGRLGNSSLMFFLEPGPCSNMTGMTNYLYNFYDNNTIPAWSFVKLERDGRFYAYAVNSGTSPPSIQVQVELYTLASYATDQAHFAGALDPMPYSWWGECDVPMACGPLGVCSSQAGICTCPDAVNFLNPSGSGKGCTRSTSLPPCSSGNEHMSSTDYLQLNHTASIFLFGGWAYNSTSAAVEICKKTCSSNCSCTGFFYQSNTSACFFITKEITLLNVTDTNLTYTDSSSGDQRVQEIFARNYVTYLKVTSAAAESSTAKHVPIAAVAVLASFVACLVLGLAVYLFRARKCEQASQAGDQEEELELRDILPVLPTRFSYQDLHKATQAFSKLLGAGGCGSVYSGVLPDGRKIAVKFLEFGLLKGHAKQFLAEVSTMGRTSHHNIVRLVGFCWEVSNRLLVYEYVERGSLDHWLFVKEGAAEAEAAPRLLDWKTRYNVALGMARGLSYLHEDCPQPILHFDIKPQNILLDGAFVAKLADFGMSRLMQRDVSEVVTGVRGTPGYIAPEWVSHGVVGKKSDVYSMGMVMLEIVGGRRNVDVTLRADSAFYPEEWYFPSWAAEKCNRGLMMEVVDKRLLQTFDEEQAQRLIHTAFWCIHENPSMRPYAPTVVQWLEGNSPVKEPPFSISNAMSYPSLDSCQKSHCSSFTLDAMSNHPPLTR